MKRKHGFQELQFYSQEVGLIQKMNQEIEGFIAKTGVTYRVLMPYKGERHILLHLELKKDVSLYLFDKKPKKVIYGQSSIVAGTTQTTVDITKGAVIDDPVILNSAHISFHGSGVIKNITNRAIGHPLRMLKEGVQVCLIAFPHLSKLPIASNVRQSDITINYPLDEACPLALNIIASPRRKVPQINVPEVVFQWDYAFIYERLLEKDDLVIILHFYHKQGNWPIDEITVYPINVHQFKTKTP